MRRLWYFTVFGFVSGKKASPVQLAKLALANCIGISDNYKRALEDEVRCAAACQDWMQLGKQKRNGSDRRQIDLGYKKSPHMQASLSLPLLIKERAVLGRFVQGYEKFHHGQ